MIILAYIFTRMYVCLSQVGGICLLLLGMIATHCMVLLVNIAHKLTDRYVHIMVYISICKDYTCIHCRHPQFQTLNYAQTAEVAMSEYSRKRKLPTITGYGLCNTCSVSAHATQLYVYMYVFVISLYLTTYTLAVPL